MVIIMQDLKVKKLMTLIKESSKHMTKDERKPILNEIALELNEELPVIYVYHWNSLMVINPKIKTLKMHNQHIINM